MINLYTNFYKDKNPIRQKEIEFCLDHNMRNPHLNFVPIESDDRLTYANFFKVANKITGPNDINIIANTDIYFDETVLLAKTKLDNATVFALSRWDVHANGQITFFDRPDSQDSWWWRGKMDEKVLGNFCLGKPGCDNKLANDFSRQGGYRVINPSKSIKTYHLHISQVRTYRHIPQETVDGPFMTVQTCSL